MLNGPTVSFAVCEPFDFPNASLLMAPLQHETWHVIHYSVHVPPFSAGSIWPLLSPDTQIPFPRPGAVFVGTVALLLFHRGNGVTMMSDCSRSRRSTSNSDRMLNNRPCPLCSAQLLIEASWQSGGNNYEWWRRDKRREWANSEVIRKASGRFDSYKSVKIKPGWKHVLSHRWAYEPQT